VEPDWGEVERVGLLADAEDVEDRKELLRFLAENGVTVAEMVAAHQGGGLLRMVGARTIRPGAGELTLREVAARAGTDVEVAQRVLRSLGAIAADPDEPTLAEMDVELVEGALLVLATFGEQVGWPLLRRFGALIERLTEAISSAVIREQPSVMTSYSGSEAASARAWTELAALVPPLGRLLDLTVRHQVEVVSRYLEGTDAGQTTDASFVVGVGFVDLSGYTAASRLLELQDLGGMIADFEGRATEVVADHGGRIVKFVGDAVLFVCSDPDALVTIAQTLVAATADASALRARAGLARGPVLARDGDYFGPTVNLAARLVDAASPGTVLVDDGLRAALAPDRWDLVTEEPVALRGFDEPVQPHRVTAR
jgi:class 3 adenylate cyclase